VITVHHLNRSRSQRVLWLLEELEIPYELKLYQRNTETLLAPPELLNVHPLGKSPVITDDGLTLAESGAIIEYLVEVYGQGRLKPAARTPEWVRYLYWMHFAEGSLMPPLVMKLVFDRVEAGSPWLVRPIAKSISSKVKRRVVTPNITRDLDYMESELSEREWFTGAAFTAADVQMSYPVEAAVSRAGLDRSRPHLYGWLERVRARPAYQRAIERGGPVTLENPAPR
jgi:glutathione S-transferase